MNKSFIRNFSLDPENMEIKPDGIKNFFWPLKAYEIDNFKNKLLSTLENCIDGRKDMDIIKMHIPMIRKDITNFFIAKKFSNSYLKLTNHKKKTFNTLIDEIIFEKKISLSREINIILKGLKKKNIVLNKLKKIRSLFFKAKLSYIEKKRINKTHIITFSNNYLIYKKSKYLNKKYQVRTSNFQDWIPSGSISIKENLKKKKKLYYLVETVIYFLEKHNLKLNKTEKNHIEDIFYYWFALTEFFLSKLEKSRKYLPKKIWIGSAGIFYNRIFAYLVKKSGGIVYGFDHGMSTGCINTNAKNILELSNVDYFYTFTNFMKSAIRNNFVRNKINKNFNKKNILKISTKSSMFFKKKISRDDRRILYVPRMFTDINVFMGDTYLYPDIIYCDWQIRLINYLILLDYKINIKSHPGSKKKFPKSLSNLKSIKIIKKSFNFNKLKKDYNLLIFDCIQNTAFIESIQTDIPKVFINTNEYQIKSIVKSSIKKRCGYVDCYINKNRIKIKKNLLADAIKKSAALRQDKTFYNYYFK